MVVITLKCHNSMHNTSCDHKFGHKKQIPPKFDFDKRLYREKIQSAFFIRSDRTLRNNLYQEIIDMSQYFKNEDILYEVLSDMEDDMVFDEICLFYRNARKNSARIDDTIE